MEKQLEETLFAHEKNKTFFLQEFMKNHQNYLLDTYQNLVNKWVTDDNTVFNQITELVKKSPHTEGTFCREHIHYTITPNGKLITRGGAYCLLLACGLMNK